MAPSRMPALFSVLEKHFRALDLRFQRKRIWTPERVMMGMIMLVANPSLSSLEALMAQLVEPLGLSSAPSDSTFVEARQKFAARFPHAMRDLWHRLVQHAVELIPTSLRTIGGRQWIAVDGSWVWAPHEAGIIARWGRPKTSDDKRLHFPQLLLVTAIDVLTRVPLAATALPHNGSERAGLRAFIDQFKAGMVLMVDRGFPAKDLLASLVARKADILWRMGTAECNSWDCVYRFLRDPTKPLEATALLPLGPQGADGSPTDIPVRLFRRVPCRGRPKKGQKREQMVLMTTLLDATAWPADKLIAMYERRWVIEDWFRDMKCRFGLEAFHSRSDTLIEQEIHSLLAWMTVCAIVERDAYRRVERSRGWQNPEDPHRFQINRANLYEVTARIFTRLLSSTDVDAVLAASETDLQWLDATARRRRPKRSYVRVRKGPHGRWNG